MSRSRWNQNKNFIIKITCDVWNEFSMFWLHLKPFDAIRQLFYQAFRCFKILNLRYQFYFNSRQFNQLAAVSEVFLWLSKSKFYWEKKLFPTFMRFLLNYENENMNLKQFHVECWLCYDLLNFPSFLSERKQKPWNHRSFLSNVRTRKITKTFPFFARATLWLKTIFQEARKLN